jgi:hypothetical protein
MGRLFELQFVHTYYSMTAALGCMETFYLLSILDNVNEVQN